jgi:hypothetical protein
MIPDASRQYPPARYTCVAQIGLSLLDLRYCLLELTDASLQIRDLTWRIRGA